MYMYTPLWHMKKIQGGDGGSKFLVMNVWFTLHILVTNQHNPCHPWVVLKTMPLRVPCTCKNSSSKWNHTWLLSETITYNNNLYNNNNFFIILKAFGGSTAYNTADCVTASQTVHIIMIIMIMGGRIDRTTHHLLLLSPLSFQLEHVPQLLMRNFSEPWQEWWRRCPVTMWVDDLCWIELTPFCTLQV